MAQAYLFPVPGVAFAAAAARAAGVTHVVLLSSASAAHAENEQIPDAFDAMTAEHHAAELAVARTGLRHTFLRPGPFMGDDLVWAPQVRATGTVSIPYPDAASAPIDERDVADVAVAALQDPGLLPERLLLTGPESLTPRVRVALIAVTTGMPVRLAELSADQTREKWADIPDGGADHIVDTLARSPASTPVTSKVGGLRRRTYRDWACAHRAEFTPRNRRPAGGT